VWPKSSFSSRPGFGNRKSAGAATRKKSDAHQAKYFWPVKQPLILKDLAKTGMEWDAKKMYFPS
jgi:hypothetical protein